VSVGNFQEQEVEAAVTDSAGECPVVVLMVDDQPIVGEAIRRALLNEPRVSFHYCADPAGAIAVAKQVKPTVILQDLVMPGVNGLDFIDQYRADPATNAIPIIVLSSKEDPKVKSDAFKAGANDYLVKLPDRVELIARVLYHSMAYTSQLQRDDAYRREKELERRLMHSQKLEALGTLAGGVAHDLNNTLVPIVTLSRLALDDLPEDSPVRGDLETIIQASERARPREANPCVQPQGGPRQAGGRSRAGHARSFAHAAGGSACHHPDRRTDL
jgi:CheY-like chemotaxis protein